MHQAAEQLLNDVLLKYGTASCDTPHMLEALLRKHGRACPQEVEVMSAALRCGVVSQLRSDKGSDAVFLARLLARNAHVPQATADWVVRAWSDAIARAPARIATPIGEEGIRRSNPFSAVRVGTVLVLAAATGAIACLMFGH
jgi:hypothetical protein